MRKVVRKNGLAGRIEKHRLSDKLRKVVGKYRLAGKVENNGWEI